jgi:hypothetical protein
MPLIGGGGAGNIASGGNPSGTGSNLNYIGDHVYLYSGTVGVINTETTLFDCSSGSNQYITAKLQIFHGTTSNEDFTYKIKLNSEIILQYTGNQASTSEYMSDEPIILLIPPNSRVIATATNDSSSTPRTHTATLTGRVYA